MIHIDVFMVITGKCYEFACDPDVPVSQLCRQMTEAALEIEEVQLAADDEYDPGRGLRMFSIDLERELSGERSLSEQRIRGGTRMIVVNGVEHGTSLYS